MKPSPQPRRPQRSAARAGPVQPIGAGMPLVRRAPTLDRDARAFLRYFNLFARRPIAEFSLRELRRLWSLLALTHGRRVPVADISEHPIDGPAGPIRLTIYRPDRQRGARPAFLWCHGGGFLVGGFETADSICRNIARSAGVVVVSVRYRLAPEHDLFAGREDFLAAVSWVGQHGESIGIDSRRLAIGGDSAGGNIAAAVAQACARQGLALKLQVLAYPATNVGNDYPSKAENASGYMLTAESMDWMKGVIAAGVDLSDHWISPGRNPALADCAPALIVTAGFDPIRDDGLDYAAKLRAAGVPVELLHYAGEFHGFLNFDTVLGAARHALDGIGTALASALDDGAPVDRTIEIGDEAAGKRGPLRTAAGELASATLMTWESIGQWSGTLLRMASPTAAAVSGLVLLPVLGPIGWARRGIAARLGRLEARQTYPAPAAAATP